MSGGRDRDRVRLVRCTSAPYTTGPLLGWPVTLLGWPDYICQADWSELPEDEQVEWVPIPEPAR